MSVLPTRDLRADAASIAHAAEALALGQGFLIDDRVEAATGSRYFTARLGAQGPALRVRISSHGPAGWQVREHYAFVTWACVRRARRDLTRLARRLDRLRAWQETSPSA